MKRCRLVFWAWMAEMVDLDKNSNLKIVYAQKTLEEYGSIFTESAFLSPRTGIFAPSQGIASFAQSCVGSSISNECERDALNTLEVGNILQAFMDDGLTGKKSPLLTQGNDLAKTATGVQEFFKDNKFIGDVSEYIELTVKPFDVCANQLQLASIQKTTFFVNALGGATKDYCL